MIFEKSINILKEYITYSKFTPNNQRWKSLNKRGYKNIQKSLIGHSLVLNGKEITIEEGVFINNNVYIECHAPVNTGSRTALGPGTKILTANHDLSDPLQRAGAVIHQGVTIGKGCWIGANVTILPGVTIAEGSVIGAGAVVTKDTTPPQLIRRRSCR